MPELDQLDPSLALSNPALSLSASLTSTPTANAQLIPTPDGAFTRIVWLNDEYERINNFLHKSITTTQQDYEAVWSKRDRNKRAYEGLPVKGEAITLPMCRSNTNQQHAWLMDTLFSREPFMDCEALGDRKFTIVVKDPDTGVHTEQTVTATDEAQGIRDLINYKWVHRLPMHEVLSAWAMEALQDGNLPALVKIIHDDRYSSKKIGNRVTKTVPGAPPAPAPVPAPAPPPSSSDSGDMTPEQSDSGGGGGDGSFPPSPIDAPAPPAPTPRDVLIVNSPEFVKYQGETVRIITVPGENFLKPFSAPSIEESPWVSHFFDEPVYETHRKLSLGLRHEYGGYDFCLPDDQQPTADMISDVLNGTSPVEEQPNKRASRSVKEVNKQRELSPLDTNVIHEVYFRWPILTEAEAASPAPTIEWMECSGYFHLKARKLLSAWLLPNWNGARPFEDFFMRPRPNSYSGTCTVEDIAPFQHYASHLFHLQVQNMVMRNVSVFFVRKGSAAATSIRGRKLHPGMIVEFDDPEDIQAKPLGTPIESIASEIQFLKSGAQEMSLVTQYDSGTADLSRVAGAAFSQQQDLAKMQPQQVYDNFCRAISRLALKYIQFLIQYAPEQRLPQFSTVTDAIIDNVLHLPREMVMAGDFSIYPVATPRDETKQMESQRDMNIAGAIDKANQFMLSMWGLIAKPGVPPPFVIIGMTAIQRSEKILKELISHTRHDPSEYVVPQETLMGLLHQLYEMQQQLQAQQQQQQQQQQPPPPEGAQPQGGPPPGGPPGGPQGAPPPPPQGMPQGMPQGGPPPPQPPPMPMPMPPPTPMPPQPQPQGAPNAAVAPSIPLPQAS